MSTKPTGRTWTAVAPSAFADTLRDCLLEARPVVQLIFFVRLIAGAALAAPWLHGVAPETLLPGILSWGCAVVFVYLFNGSADIVEDQASEKNRPIAQGHLPQTVALKWCRGFATTAVLSGLWTGPLFTLLVVAMLALGYLYSAPGFGFKRHYLGAAAVATLGGALTFLAGFLLGGGELPNPSLLLLTAAMSAWMGCVGSVAKDFSDVHGDKLAGRRTLVVIFGKRAASVVVAACALCVATSFAIVAWNWVPAMRVSATVMLAGSFCVTFLALVHMRGAHPRNPYRAFMATQYAATLSVLPV
ncbi:UbiA prenyltransferase family protein [Amycolatopsis sp. H20-H5]|uniref:UbiA prenyltransferase family protein n=1 Tax=Amycolatopsis sp. H20-H5 TaxID=3046309 RepID=UPI002DBDF7D6|nr:UbiA family prenyltransferase [Amycolatopsis sp. H20-H5]MEC3974249.1 UbiA family prenyltransferase [Amycolatopsis sp. H20-H5]